eukprot:8457277-Prorocentrum_lima.AAC.1
MVESSNKDKTEEDAEDVEGLHDMEEDDLLWEWVRSKGAWIKKELGRWKHQARDRRGNQEGKRRKEQEIKTCPDCKKECRGNT